MLQTIPDDSKIVIHFPDGAIHKPGQIQTKNDRQNLFDLSKGISNHFSTSKYIVLLPNSDPSLDPSPDPSPDPLPDPSTELSSDQLVKNSMC